MMEEVIRTYQSVSLGNNTYPGLTSKRSDYGAAGELSPDEADDDFLTVKDLHNYQVVPVADGVRGDIDAKQYV